MNKKIFLSLLAIVMVLQDVVKVMKLRKQNLKIKLMNVGIVRMILLREKDI